MELEMHMDEYLPLRDVVFNTLRRAILKGELKPGERLMEIALAEKLGVSRTPIREAIRKLELEGLVVMAPRKGAKVASITERDLNDVLEVRKGMEVLAVSLACQRITREELEKLDEFIKKNKEKRDKKRAKKGITSQNISQQARMNVRNIEEPRRKTLAEKSSSAKDVNYDSRVLKTKPGSLASKANMVAQFDEENKRKKK